MTDILKQLNEPQQLAVVQIDGPVMVIAGAGSGKTRVLTYRIAYMLKKGIDPFNILALTFTNKASREMKERILDLIGNTEGKNVWMGTFHSIFARILRSEGHLLGYSQNFSIYDNDDSKNLIKKIVNELNLDSKIYSAALVLSRISLAKSNLISCNDYVNNAELIETDKKSHHGMIGTIYKEYQNQLFRASAMDFDDLLFNTNVLFRDFPDILEKYQKKFKYILVDEYQDTNYAQYLIIKKLVAKNRNICIVGDDAQSIYSFRGANITNILNFQKDYPEVKLYKLEQNYRSTKNIVNAANSIIKNNKHQIYKEVWSDKDEGNLIKIIKAPNDTEEGNIVANSIFEHKMNKHLPNTSFAVLYRTNAQSRAIEDALLRLNIPYRIYGGLSFYKRKEIKDILAYLKLVANTKDDESFLRIINYPARGIGKTTLEKLSIIANEQNLTYLETIRNINNFSLNVSASVIDKLKHFANNIFSFNSLINKINAFELSKKIIAFSGIIKELSEDISIESISKVQNSEELLNALKNYVERSIDNPYEVENIDFTQGATLDMFLQEISLLTDADEESENIDTVSLMTIHSAKGLEFPYVYIVGLEENLFPSNFSLNSREDIEEERRLFYVAVTRAKENLTLCYADMRYRWGNLTSNEISRFIVEVDTKYIEQINKHKNPFNTANINIKYNVHNDVKKLKKISNLNAEQPNNENSSIEEIKVGKFVKHSRFGKGEVIKIEGEGANKKAIINFNNIGDKQLLLKFAKLIVIE